MKFNIPFLKTSKREEKVKIRKPELALSDIVAPSLIEIKQSYLKINERLAKTFFIFSYPRYLSTGWTSPAINLSRSMDISFHIHPIDSGHILRRLRKKITEIQAEMIERQSKGLIRDPSLETAYQDIEALRDSLQTARERIFRLGVYITIYGDSQEELTEIETELRSIFESRLIYIKPVLLKEKQGFNSTAPYGLDQLLIHTPMNTEPLSSIFPFTSPDLSANEGILYGVNQHNNSLVLFDRFTLENANSVIFAKSGSGKSYFEKLEILRYLISGVDVIVIDPDNEYQWLAEAVNGFFFNISLNSEHHLNPFDLPQPREDESPADVLRSNIINLVGLFRIMLKGLTPEEDGIVDQAITETYALKDITPESDPSKWKENIPLMSDFENVLSSMEGSESLLQRVRKFTSGNYGQFFNQPSNIQTDKPLLVFGVRDMEEELRPAAMFIILRYIWNNIRANIKRRILLIDEAWWIMQSEDGASFLYGVCKRARKYGLGVSTITQDVEDFMKSDYGRPIITNSSLQFLMKQSPATIDYIQKTFNLTNEEKYILLECEVGEGIFIAGQKRVFMKVVASYTEDQIITSSPEEIKRIKEKKNLLAKKQN